MKKNIPRPCIAFLCIFAACAFTAITHADWQWLNPLPQGNEILSIHGFSDHIVFAGGNGMVMERSGSQWLNRNLPSQHTVPAIWCIDESCWWAVTREKIIWRFDGNNWDLIAFPYSPGELNSIWASGSGDVWVGGRAASSGPGSDGTAYHYDGTQWSAFALPDAFTIHQIWGLDATHIYASGDHGLIFRFDGMTWTTMPTGTYLWLQGIWGTAPNDLYTAGYNDDGAAAILHWNGTLWDSVYQADPMSVQFTGISGIPGNGIAVIAGHSIYRYDGTDVTTVLLEKRLNATWGAASGFYAGGDAGYLASEQNESWSPLSTSICEGVSSMVVADTSDVLFGCIEGSLIHWNGSELISIDSSLNSDILDMWGQSTSSAYVLTQNDRPAVHHWNGTALTRIFLGEPNEHLSELTGNPSDQIYVSGWIEGTDSAPIYRWNGLEWTSLPSTDATVIMDMWSPSADKLFAVGDNGYFGYWDGAAWSNPNTGVTTTLHSVWGVSPNNVFIGSTNSVLLHYDGIRFQSMRLPCPDATTINTIWGLDSNYVFAAGSRQDSTAVLLFGDGLRWSMCEDQPDKQTLALGGTSPNAVFLAGESGMILRGSCSIPQYEHGAYIELNSAWFQPGDPFRCDVKAVNGSTEKAFSAILYVVLDIGTGDFFFWPSWTHFPDGIDSNWLDLQPEETDHFSILDFVWPQTDFSMSDLRFWSVMTDQEGTLIGNIDVSEWGFGA